MSLYRAELALSLRVYPGSIDSSFSSSKYYTFPVVSFVSNFQLNTIPVCECEIGVGANISSGNHEISPGEGREWLKRKGVRAVIVAAIEGEMYSGVDWPADPTIVFDGVIMSSGAAVSHASAEFKITIMHWLFHLQMCHAASRYVDPSLVGERGFYTTLSQIDEASVDGTAPSVVQSYIDFDIDKSRADLWAGGIRQMLANFMDQEYKSAKELGAEEVFSCGLLMSVPTKAGLEALQRIEGPSDTLPTPYSEYAVPIKLVTDDSGEPPDEIYNGVFEFISSISIDYLQSSSVWSLLAAPGGILSELQLAIVPLVDKALIVPVCRSLSKTFDIFISSYDIISIQTRNDVSIPVRAVVMSGTPVNLAGEMLENIDTFVCYPTTNLSADTNAFGIIHQERLPAWLSHFEIPGIPSDNVMPGVGAPDVDTSDEVKNNTDRIQQTSDVLVSLAKSAYIDMANGTTSCAITSRLRFDIAPGSTVRITSEMKDRGEALEPNSLRFETPIEMIGYVVAVTTVVSTSASGKANAYTQYQLSHVREVTTSSSDETSVDRPPLYEKPFLGAPLVDKYWKGNL